MRFICSWPIASTMPAPTQAAADVVSIYSDAYTNVANQGFNQYGAAAFEEVSIMGNTALKYTFVDGSNGNFQVLELGGPNQINAAAAGMTNFRFDLWFPNAVNSGSTFLMKVVNIMGSATEANITITPSSNPAMAQGTWLQYDVPLATLQANGLAGISNIQQVVVDLVNSGQVYIDNIYFYKVPAPTEPTHQPSAALRPRPAGAAPRGAAERRAPGARLPPGRARSRAAGPAPRAAGAGRRQCNR